MSTAQGASGGLFQVTAKTSNGAVALAFKEAPLDAVQHVDAQSSNGDVSVQMPAAFEGAFRLSQSFRTPVVDRDNAVRDPAGVGRPRNVGFAQDRRGTVTGRATWGEPAPGKTLGNVNIKTSNGNTKIVL